MVTVRDRNYIGRNINTIRYLKSLWKRLQMLTPRTLRAKTSVTNEMFGSFQVHGRV